MTEATYRPVVDTHNAAKGCTVNAGPGAVQLPGGGVLQVRGAAVVGDRVFVRDGLIEGLASALTVLAIDI